MVNDDDEVFVWLGKGAFAAAFVPLLVTVGLAVNGWVLTYLWQWFVTPLFALREISVAEAIGLVLVFHQIKGQYPDCKTEERKGSEKFLVATLRLAFPLINLLIGYVVSRFIY